MASFLSEDCAIQLAIAPASGTAGTSDITGVEVDMAGFDGVLAIVTFGAITSGAVTKIKWQQDTATGMASAADLYTSAFDIYDTDDEKVKYIDLYRPKERFVRLVVDRGTQNAVVASAVYIKYNSRKRPVTHGTGVTGERLGWLAEGDATIASTSPSASQSPSASVSPSASSSPS
jgi:hypothetical protein